MMRRKKTRKDYIKEVAWSHTNLNTVAAILALCESSLFNHDCYGFESRIVKMCRDEMQKCLRRYDRAMTLATKEKP